MKRTLLASASLLAAFSLVHADIIAQWNFNSVPPDATVTTGNTNPSVGLGTALLAGGTSAIFASGSTNDPVPTTDNSGWDTKTYPAQSIGNKTAGPQFNVSTVGYSNIVVRWDQRVSGSASKYFRFQYSSDGSTFTDWPNSSAMTSSQSAPLSYYEAQTNSLAPYTSVNNNANFAVRVVSEWQSTATGGGTAGYVTVSNVTYSTGGTVHFDMVTISGIPIPGANTAPVISSVPDQTMRVNQSTAAIPFTVGDAEDAASYLTLSKATSDASVIPAANIVFGGSGSNRTVTVTAANQLGTATITLWVIDTGGRSNSASFAVSILPLNTTPVISSFTPTNTLVNTATLPIGFTVYDLETPSGTLAVSGTSANTGLVPNAGIVFGGSGSNRNVTITPSPGQNGVAVLTISVSDGTNVSSSPLAMMVTPSTNVIFYDPFSYADGSLVTNSGFLWANSSGTPSECVVTNRELQVSSALTEDVAGSLIGAPYARSNSTVLYAGFKVKFLSLPKVSPGYFAHFTGGSNFRGRVFAGTTNAASGFRLQVANGSTTNTELTTDLSLNTNYTVVTRYAIDTATTTLWLNPALESDPNVTATDAQSAVSISSYGFRQDSGVGADILVDDLRVGLSFAAVLPTASSPSPIPLTIKSAGANVILTWPNPAFALQTASAAAGSFTNIAGATSPFTNAIGGVSKYFRLKAN